MTYLNHIILIKIKGINMKLKTPVWATTQDKKTYLERRIVAFGKQED